MGIWVLYAFGCWPWLYIGCGYIVLEHSTHLVWLGDLVIMQLMSLCCGLLIVWTLIGVEVFSNWNFFSAKTSSWGLKTQTKNKQKIWGGGRWKISIFCSSKNVPGVLKSIWRGGGGQILGCLGRPTPPPGGRAGLENDTLLHMTMTCDRFKFWSGPAWRSKVIIRKPWRWKKKKK